MNLTKLDKVFSEYRRRKEADENGICKCISCPTRKHWKDVDCGHYINRKHLALRYNEINTAPQCRACNRFDEGNLPAFGIALQEKYGEDIIKKLLSIKSLTTHWTQFEIDELTKFYKEEIKKLNGN